MLGHLKRAGHDIVPDAEARVVLVNTCGFIDRAKEESVEAILEQVERKKRGEIDRVVVAGCMVQKYGARALARDSRRWTPSSVSTSSRTRRPRRRGSADPPALHGQAARDAALRRALPARALAASGLRVSEGRRGMRQPVHVLHDSRRCAACSAAGRSSRSWPRPGRSRPQGVSELVLISQDTTRYGEDLGMGRGGTRAPRRGAAAARRPFRGSGSSTPIRRPSTTRCSS